MSSTTLCHMNYTILNSRTENGLKYFVWSYSLRTYSLFFMHLPQMKAPWLWKWKWGCPCDLAVHLCHAAQSYSDAWETCSDDDADVGNDGVNVVIVPFMTMPLSLTQVDSADKKKTVMLIVVVMMEVTAIVSLVLMIVVEVVVIIIIIIIIAFKGAIQDFLQSPHSAANCLQHVRSRGQGAVVCKSRATHQALITCHLVRRDSSAIKFDRVEIAFIWALFYWLNH